jgi:hypothetical protein
MPSTSDYRLPSADWRAAGLRYHRLGWHWKRVFGQRVWKVTLDAGLGCPNRDGTLGRTGCVFCDPMSFSPARRSGLTSITAQIDLAAERLSQRHRSAATALVAYFQPGSNTYGPLDRLRTCYEEAIRHPHVVGLGVGTRPDCVADDVLDLLAELAGRTQLVVELGIQTLHDASLEWIGRQHDSRAALDALQRAGARGLAVGAHVILGLPGETPEHMRATADGLSRAGIHSVKLHNLYAVRNTPLAEMLASGSVTLPTREQYIGWAVDFLERLRPEIVVDRLSGDAPDQYLIGPAWCAEKGAVRAGIEAELASRDTWQGRLAAE